MNSINYGIKLIDNCNDNQIFDNEIINKYDKGGGISIKSNSYLNYVTYNYMEGYRSSSGKTSIEIVDHSDVNFIIGNDISKYMFGIKGKDSSFNVIEYNTISKVHNGIIASNNFDRNKIRWNEFKDGATAIYFYPSCNHNRISNNTMLNTGFTIWFNAANNNIVRDNNISELIYSMRGIYVFNGSYDNSFINNTISKHGSGILFENAWENNISYNKIFENGDGILLEETSCGNTIMCNNISNNNQGIIIMENSVENHIYHNTLSNIIRNGHDACTNFWDNGYPSGGNYWSDYMGIDIKNGPDQDIAGWDLIGDSSYLVPGSSNKDNYPLMNPIRYIAKLFCVDCRNNGVDFSDVTPGSTVYGSFCIVNRDCKCAKDKHIDWAVTSWPNSWGSNWAFNPSNGQGLTPLDGYVTIFFSLNAPYQKNTLFTGEITVCNVNDYNDCCTITVRLKTNFNSLPDINDLIDGVTSGKPGEEYIYSISAIDPDGDKISYFWDWGDDSYTDWLGPYFSGETCTTSHIWDEEGTYNIRVKAKDIYDAETEWITLEVSMPKNKPYINKPLLFCLIENQLNLIPIFQRLLQQLLKLNSVF
jgi:parallel beta-helix repeat protein